MNPRARKAKEMMKGTEYAAQFEQDKFKVRSQTTLDKFYIISRTGKGLVCECPDHQNRHSDCKHIKIVLEIIKKNQCYKNNKFKIMDRSAFNLCIKYDSGNVHKWGTRDTKQGKVQRYKCSDCGKRFCDNLGFERMRRTPKIITDALQMQNSKMSCRRIADFLEQSGINVSYRSVFNWVAKYAELISPYTESIIPRTTGRFIVSADEIHIKFSGIPHWMYGSIEYATRYWITHEVAASKFQHNTDEFVRATLAGVGRFPAYFKTDGLPAYGTSARRVFGKKTIHISSVHLKRDMNNNRMERFNEELRGREKVCWGLKNPDTPVLPLYKIYYNFIKKHMGVDGKTPAEAAGIIVEGQNKWITLIQNARKFELDGDRHV